VTVKDLRNFIDSFAPFDTQSGWDNSGFLAGDDAAEITGVLTCLDVTDYEIQLAAENGCNTIVSHHPIIFRPLKAVTKGSVMFEALSRGMNIICAHTNLDKSVGGVNDCLCTALGMDFKKEPPEIAEGFLNTGFIAGVSTPEELAEHISSKLGAAVRYVKGCATVGKIGVCSGSAAEMSADAKACGCNAYITGDARYHEFLDAAAAGVSLFAAGHFETENIIADILKAEIAKAFPDTKLICSDRSCPVITITP